MNMTPAQETAEKALKKKGYRFANWMNTSSDFGNGTPFVMIKKPTRFQTFYAEVETDGSVNGEPLADFTRKCTSPSPEKKS